MPQLEERPFERDRLVHRQCQTVAVGILGGCRPPSCDLDGRPCPGAGHQRRTVLLRGGRLLERVQTPVGIAGAAQAGQRLGVHRSPRHPGRLGRGHLRDGGEETQCGQNAFGVPCGMREFGARGGGEPLRGVVRRPSRVVQNLQVFAGRRKAPARQRRRGDRMAQRQHPVLFGVAGDRCGELGVQDRVVPCSESVLGIGEEGERPECVTHRSVLAVGGGGDGERLPRRFQSVGRQQDIPPPEQPVSLPGVGLRHGCREFPGRVELAGSDQRADLYVDQLPRPDRRCPRHAHGAGPPDRGLAVEALERQRQRRLLGYRAREGRVRRGVDRGPCGA